MAIGYGAGACHAALEWKYHRPSGGLTLKEDATISGYAAVFGLRDRGGDVIAPGAFAATLARLAAEGRRIAMLWQHDPAQPLGVWEHVAEDSHGLAVRGRLLPQVARAREAQALVDAGAIDGLSIGYRTLQAEPMAQGGRRLVELDLWEVSLVTFPMQSAARMTAPRAAIPGAMPAVPPDAGDTDGTVQALDPGAAAPGHDDPQIAAAELARCLRSAGAILRRG